MYHTVRESTSGLYFSSYRACGVCRECRVVEIEKNTHKNSPSSNRILNTNKNIRSLSGA